MKPLYLSALRWLAERNGDGSYGGKGNVLVAAGEVAPFMRATFNAMAKEGLVELYGHRRIRITDTGKEATK